jgi:hypothetical protein
LLTAFLELEAAILSKKPRALNCKNGSRQTVADYVEASSITSSDSFTLSSARLNKPQGLDLR